MTRDKFLKIITVVVSLVSIIFGLVQLLTKPERRIISVILILLGISQIIIAFFIKREFFGKLVDIINFVNVVLLVYLIFTRNSS
jgi:hypothetical protein